jgi:hypothetical protein
VVNEVIIDLLSGRFPALRLCGGNPLLVFVGSVRRLIYLMSDI